MILPSFPYLGPAHVAELKALDIHDVVLVAECDADDYELAPDHEFERYVRVHAR